MTDPDERTINRAIASLDWYTVDKTSDEDLQDIREEARAALHRLFRDRRRLEKMVAERDAERLDLREENDWIPFKKRTWKADPQSFDPKRLRGVTGYKVETETLPHISEVEEEIVTQHSEFDEPVYSQARVDSLKAELARLREERVEMVAETDRLREKNSRLREANETLQIEVNQTHEALGYARDRLDHTEVPPLRAEVKELKTQRDTLLAALSEALNFIDALPAVAPLHLRNKWHAAISEVEGEK